VRYTSFTVVKNLYGNCGKDRAFSFKQKYNEIRKSDKKVNEASEAKNGEFQQENNGEIKENKGADEGNKRTGKDNKDYKAGFVGRRELFCVSFQID